MRGFSGECQQGRLLAKKIVSGEAQETRPVVTKLNAGVVTLLQGGP